MRHTIKIGPEINEGTRTLYWNDEISHHIAEADIQEMLAEARMEMWKSNEQSGATLGKRLYEALNGSGGKLTSIIDESFQKGEPLYLYIQLPFAINAPPVELLHNNGEFQLLNNRLHIIRKINDHNRLKDEQPEKRALKLLFMACSPIDLPEGSVLQFEKEEELILNKVQKYPVEMRIEDSGSLEGLADALYEGDGYDIVHITGHAGIDPELGPVFYMENDFGEMQKVTVNMFWEKLKDFPPKLLFLSGCSTGKSDKYNDSESFGFQMVENGVSVVLGWGLPVSDTGATLLTAELYRNIAIGKGIHESVLAARKSVEGHYHTWQLLWIFTDGSRLNPLITAGQKLKSNTSRTITYKFLTDSQVKVLENGFVGRRRCIQQGMRTLKGNEDNKYGLLIRGPAGVGKSCLAGKLMERFREKELLVMHGELKNAELLQKLRGIFDRKGCSSGLEVLNDTEMVFEDKVKTLFRDPLKDIPILIYLDDFEQNLIPHNNEYHVKEGSIGLVKSILTALDWAEGETNLIITSRYPFILEVEGRNLSHEKLFDIPLMSFRDADLEKKKRELEYISNSKHIDLYMEFGKGNPRLLEWLDKIAEEENKYDLQELQNALKDKNEEYIREYLADIIARVQGKEFEHFLNRAAVFRQPVSSSAFEMFGSGELLDNGVCLTLFEQELVQEKNSLYWVTPIIRESRWQRLSAEEQFDTHKLAYGWYDKRIGQDNEPNYQYLEEAVYHALQLNNVRGAAKHAIALGQYLDRMLLYRDRRDLQQKVIDQISDEVIFDAIKEKDSNITTLLNEQGLVLYKLGESKNAIRYYDQALEINLNVYGEEHTEIAVLYNNIGLALNNLGESKKAIEYYEQALKIDLNVYGEEHTEVAVRYNNIGLALNNLGESKKAIEYYEQALKIYINVYGEEHTNVAIIYNNIGLAWYDLGKSEKAIKYCLQALEIDFKIYGKEHPKVAVRYNNIGESWRKLGEPQKTIGYSMQALKIWLKVYGEKHPNVAKCYNNIGLAWNDLGKSKKAIEYYQKSLNIFIYFFGHNNYYTKSVKKKLEELNYQKEKTIMGTPLFLDQFIKDCVKVKPLDLDEKFVGWDDVVYLLVGAALKTFLPELKEWFKLGALTITTKRMELRKKLENYAMEKELDFSSAQKAAEVIAERINEKNIQNIIEALESSDSE